MNLGKRLSLASTATSTILLPSKKSVATMLASFHHRCLNQWVIPRLTSSAIIRNPLCGRMITSVYLGVSSAIAAHGTERPVYLPIMFYKNKRRRRETQAMICGCQMRKKRVKLGIMCLKRIIKEYFERLTFIPLKIHSGNFIRNLQIQVSSLISILYYIFSTPNDLAI